MNRRDTILTGLSALTATLLTPLSGAAQAQSSYPDRPIRVMVPFAAGGVMDVVARIWAERIRPTLGTVFTENRGGASGTIGVTEVARSRPDGYTILFGNTSTQLLNAMLMRNLPYDPAKDFTAIGIVANAAISLAVHPSVPAKDLTELIAYIKAHAGQVSYGSPGTGTVTFLAGEMFKQLAGTPNLLHVPYRGGGPGVSDLVSGHIPMLAVNITPQVIDLHKTGRIRIIAICNPKRLGLLPDVPAASETIPRLVVSLFAGVFVPAQTPKAIVERIAEAHRNLAMSEEFKAKLEESGFEPVLDTPEEAQRFIEAEYSRLVPLVELTGFKLQ
jgi:tripartite-type tricarboxylate transporter receptor subunit TctC